MISAFKGQISTLETVWDLYSPAQPITQPMIVRGMACMNPEMPGIAILEGAVLWVE